MAKEKVIILKKKKKREERAKDNLVRIPRLYGQETWWIVYPPYVYHMKNEFTTLKLI